MTMRHVGTQTFNLAYDAENRLVSVTGAATASFVHDANGNMTMRQLGLRPSISRMTPKTASSQ